MNNRMTIFGRIPQPPHHSVQNKILWGDNPTPIYFGRKPQLPVNFVKYKTFWGNCPTPSSAKYGQKVEQHGINPLVKAYLKDRFYKIIHTI